MSETSERRPPVPGPEPAWLLGRRLNRQQYFKDPVAYTCAAYHRFGPVSGLTHGDRQHFFAFGPEHNRTVLTDDGTFHTVLEYATPPKIKAARRGIGLLNMNGPPHQAARRLVAPTFRASAVRGYGEAVALITQAEVGTWCEGDWFDLSRRMRELTLRIVCRVLFGVDIADGAPRLGYLVQRMLALRYFAPSIRYFPFDVPGAPLARLLSVIRDLDDALDAIVATRRDGGAGDARDLLSLLMESRAEDGTPVLSADELIGHLTTFIVAGHETSANSLAWAFALLDQHPDIAGALAEEVSALPEDIESRLARVDGLPLLDAVVKEVLRLLPPGPNTSRVAVAPAEVGGFEVPPGSQVVTSKFVTHRDEKIFPDPLRFQPGRWARQGTVSVYQYMPFGVGPHVCVGAAFATLEMKIVLAEVFRRWTLRVSDGADLSRDVGLMMSPKNGVPVTVTPLGTPRSGARVVGDIHQMVRLTDRDCDRLGW
jgi:cytochrome P450